MKKINKRKTLTILSIGLLLIAFSQIVSHFIILNDVIKGFLMGIGIGLLITSLIIRNYKKLTI